MIIPLSNLKKGTKAKIHSFCDSLEDSKKLLSLGVLPGDYIEITGKLPFGPISLKHREHSFFALRRTHASKILVEV